jgi:hypothetical protein
MNFLAGTHVVLLLFAGVCVLLQREKREKSLEQRYAIKFRVKLEEGETITIDRFRKRLRLAVVL